MTTYKAILIGPQNAGKTSLFMKQKMGYFDVDKVEPSTQINYFVKTVELETEGEENPLRRSSIARPGSMREGSLMERAGSVARD